MLSVFALAAAAVAPLEPASQQDLNCIAVFAMAAGGDTLSQEERTGVTGALMYYLGRIEGRSAGFELRPHLVSLLSDEVFLTTRLPAEAKRCGAEMQIKGTALTELGEAMKAMSAEGPAPAK